MTEAPSPAAVPADKPSSVPSTGLTIEEAVARMRADRAAAQAGTPPAPAAGAAADPGDTPEDQGDSAPGDSSIPEPGDEPDSHDAADADQPEAEPEEGEAEEGEEEPLYTVKVDGKERQVTLAELVKGYQIESTARARMEKAAAQMRAAEELRRQVEAEKPKLDEARQLFEVRARQYAAAVEQLAKSLEPEAERWAQIDWERLDQEDSVEASRQWRRYQQFRQRQDAVLAEQGRLAREAEELQAQRVQEARKALEADLRQRFPQWSDETTFKRDTAEMAAYAREVGITDQELAGWLRGRDWQILYDAMLHRRALKARQAARSPAPPPKAPAAPPPVRRIVAPDAVRANPTRTARATEVAALKARAERTGDPRDVLALYKAQQANKPR